MIEAVEAVDVVEPVVTADVDDVPEAADKTLVGSADATSTGAVVVDDAVVDPVVVDAVVDDVADAVTGDVPFAGVGGANIRINAAKLTMSEEMPEAGLTPLVASVKLVVSSGSGFNWQLGGGLFRLLGKPSLVTPISTL